MSLLELVEELALQPKRTASTNGGEYHCACPTCGGDDRFMFWPQTDRYWCRQCESKGDSIQFCRDFMGLDYRSACAKVGAPIKDYLPRQSVRPLFTPQAANAPSEAWQQNAESMVIRCHQSLLSDPSAMKRLLERGLTQQSIDRYRLGWNPSTQFESYSLWGLSACYRDDNGQERRLWLPKGIVIPTLNGDSIVKLKVRRDDWHYDDKHPKYVEISGSMKALSWYGSTEQHPVVVVESELDAILIQQNAGHLCGCVALGGVGRKPDLESHWRLLSAPKILYALDFDEAGKKAFSFWKSTYKNLMAWPSPIEKSPGDALQAGVDLAMWIASGLKRT